jgi:uncharacterized membrane protein
MAELIVIGFEGKHRGAEVLNRLESMNASVKIDLKDAVVVYRTDDGRLRVDESVQPTTGEGAAWSAILGGMLGAILVTPFTAKWKEATGISDDFVKQVGGMVQPGQSAVFVLARATDPKTAAEQFRGYGGRILRTTLPQEAPRKFQDLMTAGRP